MPTELAVFRQFLEQYRKLILWAVGASMVPIFAALFSLTPTWPSGMAGVTAIAQLLVLALVFQLLRSARRRLVSRVMVRSTIILCALLPIYLMLIALFTYTEPLSKMRFTKGYECTEYAKSVSAGRCPFLGLEDIASANYDEEKLWTTVSLSVMKSVIVVAWLGCFATLSVALGAFVVFQMSQQQK